MKKVFLLLLLLIFNTFSIFCLPVMSADKVTKKSRVNVFNKAVKNGDIEKVKSYIDAGFDPNETYWTTWFLYGTPIIGTAIAHHQNEMLDFLLENGASANPKSTVSPLQAAVICRNPYAIEKLLQAGADTEKKFMNITAEQLAINKGYNEIVSIFSQYNSSNSSITTSKNILDVQKATLDSEGCQTGFTSSDCLLKEEGKTKKNYLKLK